MSSCTQEILNRSLGNDIHSATDAALRFARSRDYAGTDPYDGLLSPLAPLLKGRLPRQVWVQAHKRLGDSLRSMTRVPRVTMTKAMALFAMAEQRGGHTDRAHELITKILCTRGSGPWGYEFDVQTRWAHYLANSPNVVATVFALRAISAMERLGEVSPETTTWLENLAHPDGFFRYTEASDRLVHNGSLLAAESLAILGGDPSLIQRAITRTVEAQASDGSWAYGEGKGLEWIDSFHTIYVLDSLYFLKQQGYEIGDSYERGLAYWSAHCLTLDGLPVYNADEAHASHDVHNVATTVGFLAGLARRGDLEIDPEPTIRHLLSHQGEDGGFRNSPKALPHMRWNQAHASYALTRWVDLLKGDESEEVQS
ncbi:prenyltransferase/squalene oxidase repeat-containing protein [Kocuria carniphila]|uniref:prenyltransferase/squalene oxidase repeat-containing protein n=1 Tax=Kocuria carniphila TaxID=262208 RepID=UPI0034CD816F